MTNLEGFDTWEVVIEPNAQLDFLELKNYYNDKLGEKSMVRFASAFDLAVESLDFMPRINRMLYDRDTERVLYMHNYNVGIVYFVDDDNLRVTVIYVHNTRQDPKTTEQNLRYR